MNRYFGVRVLPSPRWSSARTAAGAATAAATAAVAAAAGTVTSTSRREESLAVRVIHVLFSGVNNRPQQQKYGNVTVLDQCEPSTPLDAAAR